MAAQVISTKHSVLATHSVMPVYLAGTRRTRAINGRPMARSSNSAGRTEPWAYDESNCTNRDVPDP